ncbi:MAG: redoxin domain-containing protein [Armatimonadetes bacterium]|nr:redoxin domain-containing protein [Armatimonadota bacterium]MBS1727656.1 TlpA family protein disulfide reductase [Armatimonadota bacterium]
MKPILASIFALAAACSMASASDSYITIGDPAPSLKTATWIKGGSVPEFEKGKLYVVEFWATWCHPCRENIPHLTKLAKQYDGKVTFVGVSVWESLADNKDATEKVKEFVKSEGDQMDYHVAADSPKNVIADAWMKRASEGGLPTSFIIDGDGKIAWIGGLTQLDSVLEKVVEGKFDVASAREQREVQVSVLRPIDEAVQKKDYKSAVKAIDSAVQLRPKLEYTLTYPLLLSLYHCDFARGKSLSAKILKDSDGAIGAYQMMSSIFATQKDLSPEAYRFSLGLIDDALKQNQNAFMFKAMKAEVFFSLNQKNDAITWAKDAIAMAEKEPYASDEIKELMRKNLAKYEKK